MQQSYKKKQEPIHGREEGRVGERKALYSLVEFSGAGRRQDTKQVAKVRRRKPRATVPERKVNVARKLPVISLSWPG